MDGVGLLSSDLGFWNVENSLCSQGAVDYSVHHMTWNDEVVNYSSMEGFRVAPSAVFCPAVRPGFGT